MTFSDSKWILWMRTQIWISKQIHSNQINLRMFYEYWIYIWLQVRQSNNTFCSCHIDFLTDSFRKYSNKIQCMAHNFCEISVINMNYRPDSRFQLQHFWLENHSPSHNNLETFRQNWILTTTNYLHVLIWLQ